MRILIIDDHPMTCAGLSSLLQLHYPQAQVDTLHDMAGFEAGRATWDHIFLDMHLPGISFEALLQRLCDWLPRVILISASPEADRVALARRLGARGLLPKNMNIELLLDGFMRIQAGELVFLDAQGEQLPAAEPSLQLTQRQHDVYEALLSGLSNKQIARRLCISEYTVKEHVTAVLAFFRVHSRLELVLRQYQPPV